MFNIEELKENIKVLPNEVLQEILAAIQAEIVRREQADAQKVRILFPRSLMGDVRKGTVYPHIKLVTGIDRSKQGGYAILGQFLPWDREIELPKRAIITLVCADGSWRHPHSTLYVLRVQEGAVAEIWGTEVKNLELIDDFSIPKYYLTAIDTIQSLLENSAAPQ